MELTNIFDQLITANNQDLEKLTKIFTPGDIICIIGNKRKRVNKIFYRLIKVFTKNKKAVGYLISNNTHAKQDLFLLNNHISQSGPVNLMKDIDFEINRMVTHYENPVIFINDLNALYLESFNVNEPRTTELERIVYELKRIALRNKIVIITCFVNESHKASIQNKLIK